MKIAIMTDSNSGITAQEAQQLGVALLPMPIQIDGQMHCRHRCQPGLRRSL